MSYRGEGDVYGKTLVETRPKARVAVLYENTELGRDMLTGLTRAIAGKGPSIVAKQAYEYTGADVGSQIASLKASGADTLMLFATPKFFIQAVVVDAQARAGSRSSTSPRSRSSPAIMAIARFNAPELTKGALSIAFVKNPNDPIWAKDKAVALYRTIMRKHNPSGRPTDVYNWYGMTVAWTMVETLRKAGRNLTRRACCARRRASTSAPTRSCSRASACRRRATDYRPLEHVYLYRYDNKQWVRSSALLHARG